MREKEREREIEGTLTDGGCEQDCEIVGERDQAQGGGTVGEQNVKHAE